MRSINLVYCDLNVVSRQFPRCPATHAEKVTATKTGAADDMTRHDFHRASLAGALLVSTKRTAVCMKAIHIVMFWHCLLAGISSDKLSNTIHKFCIVVSNCKHGDKQLANEDCQLQRTAATMEAVHGESLLTQRKYPRQTCNDPSAVRVSTFHQTPQRTAADKHRCNACAPSYSVAVNSSSSALPTDHGVPSDSPWLLEFTASRKTHQDKHCRHVAHDLFIAKLPRMVQKPLVVISADSSFR